MAVETLVLGVDPGQKGALAFYFPAYDRISVDDMPTVDKRVDAASLAARIKQLAPTHAVVEIVHSMPKQGVASSFAFGQGYGIVLGVIAALEIPVHLVTPAKWKKACGLDSDKEKSRALALRHWPARADLFGRKKDDGRAEAALLARYFAEKVLK
jgi:Holliday junction resolvasome RuvABC endonuclease subunit